MRYTWHDLTRPKLSDIAITDIAHALAQLCRFNGHTTRFYSVAEHSVRVAQLVERLEPEHALVGLLHDAPETYLGDLTSPLKRYLCPWPWSRYRRLERRWARAIGAALGVQLHPLPDVVKWADLVLLSTERRDLVSGPMQLPCDSPAPLVRRIEPFANPERSFLDTFWRLHAQVFDTLGRKRVPYRAGVRTC